MATRIAVIGPGAIGGTIAAWLAQVPGHEVTICARTPFEELVVELPGDRKIVARPTVLTEPGRAVAVDWAITVTKAYDTVGAARWLARLVGPATRGWNVTRAADNGDVGRTPYSPGKLHRARPARRLHGSDLRSAACLASRVRHRLCDGSGAARALLGSDGRLAGSSGLHGGTVRRPSDPGARYRRGRAGLRSCGSDRESRRTLPRPGRVGRGRQRAAPHRLLGGLSRLRIRRRVGPWGPTTSAGTSERLPFQRCSRCC
jgi:hypothetical protein